MLNKLKKSNSKGFTIIEVMIVLAIAGLIILVVLLAVPALQRNARNTAIKNDVSAVAGGITEFSSNNDGQLPNTIVAVNGTVTLSSVPAGTTSATQAKVQGNTAISIIILTPAVPPPAGTIQIWLKHRCDGTASTRANAIFYSIENATAVQQKCLDD